MPGGRRGDGVSGRLVDVLSGSPDRVTPPCPHATHCGGCSVQHLAEPLYAAWKRGLAESALVRAGFAAPALASLTPGCPGTRRRADLALRRDAGRVTVGFHGRGSAAVADVPGCLVLHPSLLAAAAALRSLLPGLAALRREGAAVMTLAREGVDLWLVTDGALDMPARTALSAFARKAGLARLAWSLPGGEAEPVVILAQPTITFAGTAVALPPGAFLQATETGEAAISDAVMAALADLPDEARVADLFAGCGTLTFALAARFRVLAAEGEAAAVAALGRAANAAGLAGRVRTELRDLAARPLQPAEQKGLAAIVLDPPRDGAAAQIAAIAAGSVRRVVYVSCSPSALARDAAVLREAGFRLDGAVPVDQFLWTAHLECVAGFSR
jgi:23S rRNA (uracil1939-C5)-methyltransferase